MSFVVIKEKKRRKENHFYRYMEILPIELRRVIRSLLAVIDRYRLRFSNIFWFQDDVKVDEELAAVSSHFYKHALWKRKQPLVCAMVRVHLDSVLDQHYERMQWEHPREWEGRHVYHVVLTTKQHQKLHHLVISCTPAPTYRIVSVTFRQEVDCETRHQITVECINLTSLRGHLEDLFFHYDARDCYGCSQKIRMLNPALYAVSLSRDDDDDGERNSVFYY